MPTYEYECPDCGHAFELFQSMTAKVKRTCPECGSRKLKRLIGTGGAVLFKGGGFTRRITAAHKKDAKAAESKPKKDAESKSSGASKTKKSSGSSQSSKSD